MALNTKHSLDISLSVWPLSWCEVFPDGSTVKNLPAMQESQVGNLGQEDPLEKGMAIHYSILAWRIPWTEESGGLQSLRLQSLTRLND